jgi:hypothetical protein
MTPEEMEAEFGGGGSSVAATNCVLSNARNNSSNKCSIKDRPTSASSCFTASSTVPTKILTTPTTTESTSSSGNTACPLPPNASPPPPPPDVDYIYHLCQKSIWDEATSKKLPYFPPTFMSDGKFTRASIDLNDIVPVANEYYRSSPGEWIVLELDCKVLYYVLGIAILAQRAPESTKGQPVKCLQVFGGISTLNPDLVTKIFRVKRSPDDGTFIKVFDPVDMSTKQPKLKDVCNKSSSSSVNKTTANPGIERPLVVEPTTRSEGNKPELPANKRKGGLLGRFRGGKD